MECASKVPQGLFLFLLLPLVNSRALSFFSSLSFQIFKFQIFFLNFQIGDQYVALVVFLLSLNVFFYTIHGPVTDRK
ncbi:MAG TPA: hypothetical protein DCX46_03635, partial [Bacteroidetes bacterium]|nr:hypothetical protein [Bacteroidota bacterium]